jgi:hypothetical protein
MGYCDKPKNKDKWICKNVVTPVKTQTGQVLQTGIQTAGQVGQFVAGGGWAGFVIRNGKKFYKNKQGKWFNEAGLSVPDLNVADSELQKIGKEDLPLDTDKTSNGMNQGLKIGLIVAGVLVLGTATFFIVRSIRKK